MEKWIKEIRLTEEEETIIEDYKELFEKVYRAGIKDMFNFLNKNR